MVDPSLAPTIDPTIDRSMIRQDANTPFFFASPFEAISNMDARIPDMINAASMPTPLMTAATSFSSVDSTSYSDLFDACSSVTASSRAQSMASTFNGMNPSFLTRRTSVDRFGPALFNNNAVPLAQSSCLEAASVAFSHDFGFGHSSKQAQPPRYATAPEASPSGFVNDAAQRRPWQLSHPCSSTSPASLGGHSQMLHQADTPMASANMLLLDGLAFWLGQDNLTELADEVKADLSAPSAAVEQQPDDMIASHSPCNDTLYRPRRNAVAQLPPLVSSGLMASVLGATGKSETDPSSMPSSEWEEEPSDVEALSPNSCPLSPSTKPFASRARVASMRETNQLPRLHRILSSWDFSCDRGRYRKPSKTGPKSIKGNKARHLKAQQTKQDPHNASSSLTGRGPGRPRKNTVASMELDMGIDESDAALSEPQNACDDDSCGTQDDVTKRSLGSSKSCGNSFSLTDHIVLRPRADRDEDEVAYPNYAPNHQEARVNTGPDLSLAGQEIVDETQLTFTTDLYAPRFTRRGAYGREGWCSMCTHGEWYSMKRSQYLYHLQYDHGICSLTRKTFEPPVNMRVWNDPMQRTEGLCHYCQEWTPICFGAVRKRDYKAWFKHAHKCHRHKA